MSAAPVPPAKPSATNLQPVRSEVIIVAHNAGSLLAEAVASAAAQAGPEHVWVMDAESTDGSVDALRASGVTGGGDEKKGRDTAGTARRGAVHVIPVPNNGFAAANNRGLEAIEAATAPGPSASPASPAAPADAPFVLLLNPDAVLRPGALDVLIATGEADSRAGIIGALVLDDDGVVQAGSFGRFPSLVSAIRLRLWRMGRRLRGNTRLSPKAPTSTAAVDWVTGAAMLVRRAAIAHVGRLDEGFFLYYEDIDWCRRMRARGWEVLLEPRAQVIHRLGGSNAPTETIAGAYRASFYRYCDLYGLWGLKLASRLGLGVRRCFGGAS
jgi:hypothetical protein